MGSACCKVGRVIDEYSLGANVVGGNLNEYLVSRWRGTGEYVETGHRPLTDWFNESLLKAVYLQHDRIPTEARIESEYEVLSGDKEDKRTELLEDLRTDGIDGERLVEDFISPSTLYRHLQNCLDETKQSPADTPDKDSDWERQKVSYAREVSRENAEEALRSLTNKERIRNGIDADLDVRVVLSCPDCATRVRFETALDRGYVCREHLGDPVEERTTGETTQTDPRPAGPSSETP